MSPPRCSSPAARLETAGDDPTVAWPSEFRVWSLFDPRAAIARLEKLPSNPKIQGDVTRARLVVARSLAQTHEQRWRAIWEDWEIIFDGKRRDF